MKGPKEKKERALGTHLHLKADRCESPKCALVRKPYRPGAHGNSRRPPRGPSEFGLQLREKQKFKLSYGLDERNLRMLFGAARRAKGSTAEKIVELLERRLDNVVYRLGLVRGRSVARQAVVHGHIAVNGRKVRSPGFQVKAGDAVAVAELSKSVALFKDAKDPKRQYEPPAWLQFDREKLEGKVLALPREVEAPFEVKFLVEAFSK